MIEVLESRIAPATLIDGKTVTYTDLDGETVTVSLSLDVLTESNVNKIFKFDTGEVDGSNVAQQFLKTLDLRSLGNKAKGMDVTLDSEGPGDGLANMGYLNSAKIDLGNVSVDGNLQRIKVGDENGETRGLETLVAASLGRLAAGDGTNAVSSIFGGADTVTIFGSVVEAKLQFAGGKFGTVNLVEIGGDLIGGAEDKSGAVLATGDMQSVLIEGGIFGGAGNDSGQVASGRKLIEVTVGGDVLGAGGKRSGAILSTKMMGDITVGGDLVGGTSRDSGQIASGNSLGFVEIGGDIVGGSARFTGAVLSALGTAGVTVLGDVVGGSGEESGLIGTAGDLGDVSIGALIGGSAKESGAVLSTGNMGNVYVDFAVVGASGNRSGHVGAGGNLASFAIGASEGGALVMSEGMIVIQGQPAEFGPGLTGGSGARAGSVQALGFIGDVFVFGDMLGDAGLNSGSVIAGTGMGQVRIEGFVSGGSGENSGSIIAQNGGIASVDVLGDVQGGSGNSSGRITAEGSIGDFYITGSLIGGEGADSGLIDSETGSLGQIMIFGDLLGGDGIGSGSIFSSSSIAEVMIGGDMLGGVGDFSGMISNLGFLGDVSIGGDVMGGEGIQSGWIFAGSMGNLTVGGNWEFSTLITDAGGMGNLTFHTADTGGPGIAFSTISSFGGIGSITAISQNSGSSAFDHVRVVAAGNIGDITATVGGSGTSDAGILASTFQTGAMFASINVNLIDGTSSSGIVSSAFNARQNFGNVNVDGTIADSVFVAGIHLGADFVVDPSALAGLGGVFDNAAAAVIGFGGTGPGADTAASGPSMIGNFVVVNSGANAPGKLSDVIILSGITGAGTDGDFGTFDDANIAGSTIGGISAEDGIDPVHVASGSIGIIEADAGSIEGTDSTPNVFIANNPNGSGIGGVDAGGGETGNGSILFSFFFSASSIGNISADADSGDGIAYSAFIADFDGNGVGSVGNIRGESNYELTGSQFYGINEIVVSGASIGDILGDYYAETGPGAGIFASDFRSIGNIGNITGESGSTQGVGILSSIFQATGNIANVVGGAEFGLSAIAGSGFNAQGNIASVGGTGALDGSVFIAGIHLGADFSVLGAGDPLESDIEGNIVVNFGFGGTGAAADTIGTSGFIGSVNMTGGAGNSAIYNSSFIAGINGRGTDARFGSVDDVTLSGAFIGPVTAQHGIQGAFFESGQIDSITVGDGLILESEFIATNPSGIGIGPVSATYDFDNDEGTFGIIDASVFASNSRVGDMSVHMTGVRPNFGDTIYGFSSVLVEAAQSIGQILVDNQSTSMGSDPNIGIGYSNFLAGTRGAAGGIAGVTVNMPNYSAATNDGIIFTLFDASSNGTSAGNIGNVTTDRAIVGMDLHANGNVGNISAEKIANTLVTASGNIGDIFSTGSIGASKFLAGIDLGTDYSFGGTGTAQDSYFGGRSIGSVDASMLDGVDIIASVNPQDGVFGNGDDILVGNGSFIDKVTLTDMQATSGANTSSHGIMANFIGTFTIAASVTPLPFTLNGSSGGNNMLVQTITPPLGP